MVQRKRFFLNGVCIAFLAACASPLASASAVPAPYLIPGAIPQDRQPDGNTIIFEDEDSLVVVDTGRHIEHQDKILAYAKERGKPITAIVNTHWHLDHSGGNAEIRAVYPGAKLYTSNAVVGALDGFLAQSLVRGKARLADPTVTDAQKAEIRLGVNAIEDRANLIADMPVTGPTVIRMKGRTIELGLAKYAATAGDVWIYDPASATMLVGDLVVVPVPFFDTACADGWRKALNDIAKIPFKTMIPGHGSPMPRSEFDVYRAAFSNLVDCSQGSGPKQACIEGWLKDAATLLKTDQDRENVQEYLDYYIDNIMRSPEKKKELCGL